MSSILLGVYVPPPPPPPNSPGWEATEVTWEGADGSLWRLTEPSLGVFIMRGGMRGLGRPKKTDYRDQSPAVHGATWRGLSYEPREVFFTAYLYSDVGTKEYVTLDRAFWDSFDDEIEGTLTVRVPGFPARKLRLRLVDDGNWAPERDPSFYGWTTYGMTLQADQPLWEAAAPIVDSWRASTPTAFFGGLTPGAPIITISRGRTLAAATITNPGDVEAWPIWTVSGPCTSATISVDGHEIEVPIELEEGESVRIDTRPTEQTALRENGDDVFTLLGETDFAPIVPRRAGFSTLALDIDSTGKIGIELTPLYLRGV